MRLFILLAAILLSPAALAQLTVGISPNRNSYIAYEPVKITVSITNQAGRPLTLHNKHNHSWIEFFVRKHNGQIMRQIQKLSYPAVTVPSGETVKSTFTINNAYDLAQSGNYSVYAVVRTPSQDAGQGTRSSTSFFSVNRGYAKWKTKVGVPNVPGEEREYRIINFSGDKYPRIYVQVEDTKRGRMLASYSMGRILTFRDTLKSIDRKNQLNILFLTTPEIYCHTVIDTAGKTVRRMYYKPIGNSRPSLYTHQDGVISVENAVSYDPVADAAEKAKFHNLSEIPGGFKQ